MFVGLNEKNSPFSLCNGKGVQCRSFETGLNSGVKKDSFCPSFGLTARPMNNRTQNKQFRSALHQACDILGIPCNKDIQRKAHDLLHDLNEMGYKDMIQCFTLFFKN